MKLFLILILFIGGCSSVTPEKKKEEDRFFMCRIFAVDREEEIIVFGCKKAEREYDETAQK